MSSNNRYDIPEATELLKSKRRMVSIRKFVKFGKREDSELKEIKK